MGFDQTYAVTGQTYPRKVDAQLLDALSGVAQSLHKTATDVRLLANRKELEEPIEKNQIGSSAMPYKRNPMRSERICALTRFVISVQSSPAMTAATQWMERTLDDSANRRLVIPQAFLAIDASLVLMQNIASGFMVYPKTIAHNLAKELPYMETENIMMKAVKLGGDRQDLHERIRIHSREVAQRVNAEGKSNDMIERLKQDPAFSAVEFGTEIDPLDYVGRAPQQVDEFIAEHITPIRERYNHGESLSVDVHV